MYSRPGRPDIRLQDPLERVRREGRWWWLQARHTRRIWRWALLAAVVIFIGMALLRRPLADWFWGEPRIEQLLEQGDLALREGRLSAADGSGARERFAAALALDADRSQAREGLARTGQAAVRQAADALQRGQLDQATAALALARELQVPQGQADALAAQLRRQRSGEAGLDALRAQAEQALAQGRLEGAEDAALPLLQRVLERQPDDLRALEARDDALGDLLLRARRAVAAGQLVQADALLQQARRFDAGHGDLPQSQGELNRALEQQLQSAHRALTRQRWDSAVQQLEPVLQIVPADPAAQQLRERLQQALLEQATRAARDFDFAQAQRRLQQATGLGATAAALAATGQQIERARTAQRALNAPARQPAQRERELRALLDQLERSEAAGRLIAPPGASAYDALREAQALAPQDRRVVAAAQRVLPASRRCFEEGLRQNRVQAAGACLQAWQTLAPGEAALAAARARLAQRWLAIGSERLGSGELAFAERAAEQAHYWQPASSELEAFQQRLLRARGGEGR